MKYKIQSLLLGLLLNALFSSSLFANPHLNQWLELAQQGQVDAQVALANYYAQTKNTQQELYWLEKLAEQGNPSAQFNLGVAYEEGQMGQADYTKAVKYYTLATKQGFAEAQQNLGLLYEYGKGVDKSYTTAIKWYQKSAEQGYAPAQFNLAFMYNNARGTPKNDAKALEWYTKSAQHNLGSMYYYGRGVKQDNRLAKKWFAQACQNGHQLSCQNFAYFNK